MRSTLLALTWLKPRISVHALQYGVGKVYGLRLLPFRWIGLRQTLQPVVVLLKCFYKASKLEPKWQSHCYKGTLQMTLDGSLGQAGLLASCVHTA